MALKLQDKTPFPKPKKGECPQCRSTKTVVYNYDPVWRDGDIHCADCGKKLGMFDAG